MWRGIAMRSDKLFRSYCAAPTLTATQIWIRSDLINTARGTWPGTGLLGWSESRQDASWIRTVRL